MAAEKQKSESIVSPTAQRFVVVRVVAKPDALKNGSFDRLLADNKIEFVPQPAKNQSLSFGGGKLAKPAKSETSLKEQSNKSAESHAVENGWCSSKLQRPRSSRAWPTSIKTRTTL